MSKVKDSITYFVQITKKGNIKCVTNQSRCDFKQYEKKRINALKLPLEKAKEAWEIKNVEGK